MSIETVPAKARRTSNDNQRAAALMNWHLAVTMGAAGNIYRSCYMATAAANMYRSDGVHPRRIALANLITSARKLEAMLNEHASAIKAYHKLPKE